VNSYWCFDKKDAEGNDVDFQIYGSSENLPHRRFDLSYIPCRPVIGSESEFPDANCRIDDNSKESFDQKLDKIVEYIGQPNLYVLMNRQSL
jgi:hypothetical protein